jgi:hydroxysqualene synthase
VIHRFAGSKPQPYQALAVPVEPLELDACYRYCEALARSRHHNFPVASLFVPTALRRHIFPIYAFARTADDFATQPDYEGRRARELDAWESRLQACFHGEPADHPVFVALADTVRRFDLPITPLSSFVAGCRIEIDSPRYATVTELVGYTSMAAGSIGHLLLYMGGYRDPTLHRHAEDLASGLAFASFWQDIRSDLERDRVYLPTEDLRHFDVTEDDLRARRTGQRMDALIRYEVARTRALFARARPLVDAVGADLAIEIALMWHGGMRILHKTEALGGRILTTRPQLTAADKAAVVLQAIRWRGGALRRRGETLARWLGR